MRVTQVTLVRLRLAKWECEVAKTLDQIISGLPATQRRAVETRAAELIAEELSLRDLRMAFDLTQADLAATMGKRQDEISRIEQRSDLLLSTLDEYVRSLGGELELLCTFKDRKPVRIRAATIGAGVPARGKRGIADHR